MSESDSFKHKFVTLTIKCPICSKESQLNVPRSVIEQNPSGLVTIYVPRSNCFHAYLIDVDKNFEIRGYLPTDYHLDVDTGFEYTVPGTPHRIWMDMSFQLLFAYFGVNNFLHLMRALIMGTRVFCIVQNLPNGKIIQKYLRKLGQECFNGTGEILFGTRSEYLETNQAFSEDLVIDVDWGFILNDPFIKEQKLETESRITKKLLSIKDRIKQEQILKEEISEIMERANYCRQLFRIERKLTEEEVLKKFKKTFRIKISRNELDYLFEVVANRYGMDFKKKLKDAKERVADFLSSF